MNGKGLEVYRNFLVKGLESLNFKEKTSHQLKVLKIFDEAVRKEENDNSFGIDRVIAELSACYVGNFIFKSMAGEYESASRLVNSYREAGQKEAVIFFVDKICLPLAREGNAAAVDMLLTLKIVFSEGLSKKAGDILVELGKESKIKEMILQRILIRISKQEDLLGILSEIDNDSAYALCLKWLRQKDDKRKIFALELMASADFWNIERHLETQAALTAFWQSKELRTNKSATIPYYKLVLMAFEAKALDKQKAIRNLVGVFENRGYLYPVEYEDFKKVLTAVDPKRASEIYAEGFATAALLKQRDNRYNWQTDELESVLAGMREKVKVKFLKKLTANTTDKVILWPAAISLLKSVSKKEGEKIFREVIFGNDTEKSGTLLQLIMKISSGHHPFEGMRSKWSFLSKLVEESGRINDPQIVCERLKQIAGFGSEKDIVSIIPDFLRFYKSHTRNLKFFLEIVLTAMSRLKSRSGKEQYQKLLSEFCQDGKKEVPEMLVQFLENDSRGLFGSEVLSKPIMDFIFMLDDNCVPSMLKVIRSKRRSGDLDMSYNEMCAKFILKKAILGNKEALEAIILIPDKKIWSNVSELLVQIILKCEDEKIRRRAIDAVLSRFENAMLGKENDLSVHKEVEALQKIRHYDGVQSGFLNGLRAGLGAFSPYVGIPNALDKVADFISPDYRQLALRTLQEGMKQAKESIENLTSLSKKDYWKGYDNCVVLANTQILKMNASL
jgi:hypothetical protein